MDVRQCINNHFFDQDQYDVCPFCGGTAKVVPEENTQEKPKRGLFVPKSKSSSSQSQVSGFANSNSAKVTSSMPGKTESLIGKAKSDQVSVKQAIQDASASNDGKTFGFFDIQPGSNNPQPANSDPIMGLLVCIAGPAIGGTFNLYSGRNSIGRSANNKIVIAGDGYISREKHAVLTCDPRNAKFFIQGGESDNLVYLNGEPVISSGELQTDDIIELGKTVLKFIPLYKGEPEAYAEPLEEMQGEQDLIQEQESEYVAYDEAAVPEPAMQDQCMEPLPGEEEGVLYAEQDDLVPEKPVIDENATYSLPIYENTDENRTVSLDESMAAAQPVFAPQEQMSEPEVQPTYAQPVQPSNNVSVNAAQPDFEYGSLKKKPNKMPKYILIGVAGLLLAFGLGFLGKKIYTKVTTKNIDDSVVELHDLYYNSEAQIPDLKITYKDVELIEGKDYEVAGNNNINVGTADLVISGIGDYQGEKNIQFSIVSPTIQEADVTLMKDSYEYDKAPVIPEIMIKVNNRQLSPDVDYTMQLSSNEGEGTGKAVIQGVGNYQGTVSVYFEIVKGQSTISLDYDVIEVVAGNDFNAVANTDGNVISWESANQNIASVNGSGIIRGVSAGNTEITVKTDDGASAKAKVRVLFADVTNSKEYFFTPVYWAVSKGLTVDSSGSNFGPNTEMTRIQLATFLWRYSGSPEPSSMKSEYEDVEPDNEANKAVYWATEKGLFSGIVTGNFAVNDVCTMSEAITVLWHYSGSPNSSLSESPYKDVKVTDAHYKAVLWAKEQKVLSGSAKKFKPQSKIARGRFITYLYRLGNKQD